MIQMPFWKCMGIAVFRQKSSDFDRILFAETNCDEIVRERNYTCPQNSKFLNFKMADGHHVWSRAHLSEHNISSLDWLFYVMFYTDRQILTTITADFVSTTKVLWSDSSNPNYQKYQISTVAILKKHYWGLATALSTRLKIFLFMPIYAFHGAILGVFLLVVTLCIVI